MTTEEKNTLNREVAELLGMTLCEHQEPGLLRIWKHDGDGKVPAYQPYFTDDWRAAGMLLDMMPKEPALTKENVFGWWCDPTGDVNPDVMARDDDPKVAITLAFRNWKSSRPKETP